MATDESENPACAHVDNFTVTVMYRTIRTL